MGIFKLNNQFKRAGDQPPAIKQFSGVLHCGRKYQTLMGATDSGKTFTMANVIAQQDAPVPVIRHNKTLGDIVEVHLSYESFVVHIEFLAEQISRISFWRTQWTTGTKTSPR